MKVKIYVEGGGNSSNLKAVCREGFSKLFGKVIEGNKKPGIVACGPREEAVKRFTKAIQNNQDQISLLLVDSEGPVPQNMRAWDFISQNHDWRLESEEDQERAFLMVQLMEAWFLADREALEVYFGEGFNGNALAGNQNIEEISKQEVEKGLKNATRPSSKGQYEKRRQSYEILGKIDPASIESASTHAAELFQKLREICRQ